MPPSIVADNAIPADIDPEPSGFWLSVHAQVNVWSAKYTEGQEDDGEID